MLLAVRNLSYMIAHSKTSQVKNFPTFIACYVIAQDGTIKRSLQWRRNNFRLQLLVKQNTGMDKIIVRSFITYETMSVTQRV